MDRRMMKHGLFGVGSGLILAMPSSAQLLEREVLVVYDSSITDSRLVAEHYAGSDKVPGGIGGVVGARPGVNVVDISPSSVGAGAQIDYDEYITRYQTPIRDHLTTTGLVQQVRCIVLTKGFAHRVTDSDRAGAGDNAGASADDFNNGDATYASVDSELALLWQDLDTGENGGAGDSRTDGFIVNPYHRMDGPIRAWTTEQIQTAKVFLNVPPGSLGQVWQANSSSRPARLTPGDMYLVCRLDGPTVDDVRAMIDRAQGLLVDTTTAVVILDESNRGGGNPELDDDALTGSLSGGDDYEETRDLLLNDGRFDSANVRYNITNGAAGFSVGPLLSFDGEGLVQNGPVLLLAHEGANHTGADPGAGAGPDPAAGTLYAESFEYAPGAIFNTIESFNGRRFNGLGELGQEQASDFIGAGGTFAIGSVYEPFTLTLPDNEFLVQNFVLGGLSWAEAAYTAIPSLSWTHIVLGDPLATMSLSSDDIDGDGDVDTDDLYAWTANPTDINGDGSADADDLELLERSVRAGDRVLSVGR